MQYVQCGLAISKPEDPGPSHAAVAYLIEEYIETSGKNWFVKYLNNSSAKPRQFDNPKKALRVEFLSFAVFEDGWSCICFGLSG